MSSASRSTRSITRRSSPRMAAAPWPASASPENTTAVTTVTATDANPADTLSYSISGTDAALFDIDSVTGELTFKALPDFENPLDANLDNNYQVTVTVSDGNGGTDTQDITVTVNQVSDTGTAVFSDSSTHPADQRLGRQQLRRDRATPRRYPTITASCRAPTRRPVTRRSSSASTPAAIRHRRRCGTAAAGPPCRSHGHGQRDLLVRRRGRLRAAERRCDRGLERQQPGGRQQAALRGLGRHELERAAEHHAPIPAPSRRTCASPSIRVPTPWCWSSTT